MDAILFGNGLQITLTTLIKSLTKMVGARGHSIEGVMVLEGLKGLLRGYLGRYECDIECGYEQIMGTEEKMK